jgi:hypothetical protein
MKRAVTILYQVLRAPFWLLSWLIIRLWKLAGRKTPTGAIARHELWTHGVRPPLVRFKRQLTAPKDGKRAAGSSIGKD